MLPSSSLTDPDVQISRFRFFMEELRSRQCSDGRSGLPAEGEALGAQRIGSWGTDSYGSVATAISARSSRPDGEPRHAGKPSKIRDVDHHPADHHKNGAFDNRLIHSLRMQEQRRVRHANGKTAWRQRLAVAARSQLICLIGRFFLFP